MVAGSAAMIVVGYNGFADASTARGNEDHAREEQRGYETTLQQSEAERADVAAEVERLADQQTQTDRRADNTAAALAAVEAAVDAAEARYATANDAVAALHAAVEATATADARVAGIFSRAVDLAGNRNVDGMARQLNERALAAIQTFADSSDAALSAREEAVSVLEGLESSSDDRGVES